MKIYLISSLLGNNKLESLICRIYLIFKEILKMKIIMDPLLC